MLNRRRRSTSVRLLRDGVRSDEFTIDDLSHAAKPSPSSRAKRSAHAGGDDFVGWYILYDQFADRSLTRVIDSLPELAGRSP